MTMKNLIKKLDTWLWFILKILPLITYVGYIWSSHTMENFYTFTCETGFIYQEIFMHLDWILNQNLNCGSSIIMYVCYLVSVEILHCFFDVLVFIPRFAHECIDWATNFGKGGKNEKSH